jgi:hypothetical protein
MFFIFFRLPENRETRENRSLFSFSFQGFWKIKNIKEYKGNKSLFFIFTFPDVQQDGNYV